MKIFYCCYGGTHSSIVAASIHVGLLHKGEIPSPQDILALPHYDVVKTYEIGHPIYIGMDEWNNHVYAIGLGGHRDYYGKLMYEWIIQVLGFPKKEVLIVHVAPLLHFQTRLGGFLSRRTGCIRYGRPLTIGGILKNYRLFVKLVEEVKKPYR